MRLSDFADLLEYEFSCGGETDIIGIDYADSAQMGEIAVAFSKRDIERAKNASAVLCAPCLFQTDKPLLMSFEPIETALVKICKCLIKAGTAVDYADMCELHNCGAFWKGCGCNIGSGTKIAAGAVIENNVTIGENCLIGANAVIKSGSVIGNGVRVGNCAVIGADSFYHTHQD